MKHLVFFIAFGAFALTIASFAMPSTTPSEPSFLLGMDTAPHFPLTVVKVKGRVKLGVKKLIEGSRITNVAKVKFDSTNNIVKVKDSSGQGFFMVPRDFELPVKKACNSTICKPVLMEKVSLPGGF